MRRSYAVMMFATFVIALVAAVGPFAAAQYASGLPVPIPTSMGGTGTTSLQSGIAMSACAPSSTCGPCTIAGTSYWNADYNVSLGDGGATYSWTDVCNGYVLSQAVNASQPVYTASCYGTHHCLTISTGAGATSVALNAVGSAAFPALSAPYTFGGVWETSGTSPTGNSYLADFGAGAHPISAYLETNKEPYCVQGSTVQPLFPTTYNGAKPTISLCNATQNSMLTTMYAQGLVFGYSSSGNVTVYGTDGGLTVGNQYNGASSSSFAGWIGSFVVFNHTPTKNEQDAYFSYEQAYWGGL